MAQRKRQPHVASTRPGRSQCQSCAAEILACYVRGEPTQLDRCHLNELGEAVVLVAGGRTYEIPALGREYAARRSAAMITDGLPRYGHVHPAHICGIDWSVAQYTDGRHLFGVPVNPSAPPPF